MASTLRCQQSRLSSRYESICGGVYCIDRVVRTRRHVIHILFARTLAAAGAYVLHHIRTTENMYSISIAALSSVYWLAIKAKVGLHICIYCWPSLRSAAIDRLRMHILLCTRIHKYLLHCVWDCSVLNQSAIPVAIVFKYTVVERFIYGFNQWLNIEI